MEPWSCGKRNEHWAHGGQPDASSWLSAEFADYWYNAKQRLDFWSTAWFLRPKFCRLGSVIWVSLEWLSHTFSFSFSKNPWTLAIWYDFPIFSGHGSREESWLDKYASRSLWEMPMTSPALHFSLFNSRLTGVGIENTRTRFDLTEHTYRDILLCLVIPACNTRERCDYSDPLCHYAKSDCHATPLMLDAAWFQGTLTWIWTASLFEPTRFVRSTNHHYQIPSHCVTSMQILDKEAGIAWLGQHADSF